MVAILVGIASLPVLLLMCVLIVLVDRQNPIFAQKRLGRNEIPFTLYKLKTMRAGTLHVPTHMVAANNVSKIGSLLRRTKLDELPQLWNVIIGNMSFVGPRPGLVDHDELTRYRRELDVFSIKPGITGVSQVEKIDMSDPKKLAESDSRYLGQKNLLNDLKIIWATILGKGGGDRIHSKERIEIRDPKGR